MQILDLLKFFRLTVLILLLLVPKISIGNNKTHDEIEIKAAFMINLLKFIEYPSANKQFNICIIGNNYFKPFKKEIESTNLENKSVKLIEIYDVKYSSNCQILFISESKKTIYKEILHQVAKKPLITISDINKFAKNGGMVGFQRFNDMVKLELNTQSLSKSGFKIDPQLLGVAHNVY